MFITPSKHFTGTELFHFGGHEVLRVFISVVLALLGYLLIVL
jgi:hypothetical protein